MNFFRGILLFGTMAFVLLGCASTPVTNSTQQNGYSPEIELEVTSELEESTGLQIEKSISIILTPDFEDYHAYRPVSTLEINGVVSYADVEVVNFRTAMLNSLEEIFDDVFSVKFADEKTGQGLELVLDEMDFSGWTINATFQLYYMDINYLGSNVYSDSIDYDDLPEVNSFTPDAWRAGVKAQEKFKIEYCINNTVNKLYQSIIKDGYLAEMNFWEFPFLETEQKIGGILFPANTLVKEHYDSGNVRLASLPEDSTFAIDGIEYTAAWNTDVEFFDTGIPKTCALLENTRIDGYLFSGKRYMTFYESGGVETGVLAEETEIDGILFDKTNFLLYASGEIQGGVIARDIKIKDVDFKEGDFVAFDEDGNAEHGK